MFKRLNSNSNRWWIPLAIWAATFSARAASPTPPADTGKLSGLIIAGVSAAILSMLVCTRIGKPISPSCAFSADSEYRRRRSGSPRRARR